MHQKGMLLPLWADDTDVLVLLMYHWNESMSDVYFRSETKLPQRSAWNIRDLISKAGQVVYFKPLIHSCLEWLRHHMCYIWHGKTSLIKKLMKDSEELRQMSLLMCDSHATADQIGEAGTRVFVLMYGGKKTDTLNDLRHAKFMDMITSSNCRWIPRSFLQQKEQPIITVCGFTYK